MCAFFAPQKTGLPAAIPRICIGKSCGIPAAIQVAWASNDFASQNRDQPDRMGGQ
jgi:hypothetical protein